MSKYERGFPSYHALRDAVLASLAEANGYDELFRRCTEACEFAAKVNKYEVQMAAAVEKADTSNLEVIEWIPVEEREPDPFDRTATTDGYLLVQTNNPHFPIWIGWLDGESSWRWDSGGPVFPYRVTAWAEMPRGMR